jgi:phospholipid-translocating ATPase
MLKDGSSFLEAIDVEFVIPPPNQLIYKFEGAAHLLQNGMIYKKISLDYENTLWGGCKVGKSSVLGLVIYNGEDSKMMMSAEEIEPKRSMLVDELNDLSKLLFLIMVILSVTIVALKGNPANLFLQVFRYVLLLSTIIPISVKVNHDLSRLYYSNRINNDKDLPGCQARNSSVCEDLGRIKYILSDKTGTLTKNEMEMRKVFISTLGELTTNQYRNELGKATSKNPGDAGILEFNNCMMICHSVTPTIDESKDRVLESASPDELSFLTLMEESGYMLADKTDQLVVFNDQLGVIHKYNIEATFPFSSERKRMGVICCKEGQKDLIFYLKGADSIMKPKLTAKSAEIAMKNAEKLSSEGLRTLVLGRRTISRSEYEVWRKDYDEATAALNNRNIKVEASIERIEKDLDFIGVMILYKRLDHCCRGLTAGQCQRMHRDAKKSRN